MPITLPDDKFLKSTYMYLRNNDTRRSPIKGPGAVGMTSHGVKPPVRMAGAKLGITGLVDGIAREGIDRYVTPFLIDRIKDGVQAIKKATSKGAK